MGKYFGTDGFRGEANVNLTVDHAFRIGRYLGASFEKKQRPRIVIGKDTRRSSYMFENALTAGLTASGADVYLLHVTTTPSVSYVTRTDHFDCGIMISASHNPYTDNGIKLLSSSGEKMPDEVTDKIERYLDGQLPQVPCAVKADIGRTVDYAAGRNRYMGYLISLATHSFQGIRVGLDCANGSAWMIAKAVFEALGAQVTVIGDAPNGVNINDQCGSTHLQSLQQLVLEHHLDVGFAFDGDADRCLAVDEKGQAVTGDHILYLYGIYMKKRDKLTTNTVVSTVMSNWGLNIALKKAGIQLVQTQVGDRFVYECMRSGGHLLGGEESGHIIFSKYAVTGDGVLTAIKIMQAMLDQKQPLSKLTAPLQFFPRTQENIGVINQEKALASPLVYAARKQAEEALRDQGRIILRKSGTEPVIRVLAEHPDQALCDRCVHQVAQAIRSSI